MKDIVIIGAGGLAVEIKCLIDTINEHTRQWNLLGFIDSWGKQRGDKVIGELEVIGSLDDLNSMKQEVYAIVAMGTPEYIKNAVKQISNPLVKFANLIHPTAEIHESIKMGVGNIITFCNFVSYNAEIGDFNFFNTKCAVGHDAKIGSYNVFNPNTQISGSVVIGSGNFWGLNSSILQGKQVGDGNKIGACSFVMHNLKDNASYFGIPAKIIPLPVSKG